MITKVKCALTFSDWTFVMRALADCHDEAVKKKPLTIGSGFAHVYGDLCQQLNNPELIEEATAGEKPEGKNYTVPGVSINTRMESDFAAGIEGALEKQEPPPTYVDLKEQPALDKVVDAVKDIPKIESETKSPDSTTPPATSDTVTGCDYDAAGNVIPPKINLPRI